jgi:CheY-like chemotaxis protein
VSKRILVIDDDPAIPAVVTEILETMGHKVISTAGGEDGLKLASESSFDLVLVDLVMPGMNGAEVTRRLRDADHDVTVVVISGHPKDPLAEEALQAGAVAIVPKPFEIGTILDHLE